MTPFEKSEENIKEMAKRLILHNLIWSTIKDTEGMTEEQQELIWLAVLAMIEKSGALDEVN